MHDDDELITIKESCRLLGGMHPTTYYRGQRRTPAEAMSPRAGNGAALQEENPRDARADHRRRGAELKCKPPRRAGAARTKIWIAAVHPALVDRAASRKPSRLGAAFSMPLLSSAKPWITVSGVKILTTPI